MFIPYGGQKGVVQGECETGTEERDAKYANREHDGVYPGIQAVFEAYSNGSYGSRTRE